MWELLHIPGTDTAALGYRVLEFILRSYGCPGTNCRRMRAEYITLSEQHQPSDQYSFHNIYYANGLLQLQLYHMSGATHVDVVRPTYQWVTSKTRIMRASWPAIVNAGQKDRGWVPGTLAIVAVLHLSGELNFSRLDFQTNFEITAGLYSRVVVHSTLWYSYRGGG